MARPLQEIPIAILAAGNSSRLGRPKQLLSLNNETLLARACQTAIAAQLGPVLIILGHDAPNMQETLAGLHVHIVLNPDWQRGIGTSLRAAATSAHATAAHALIIMLCDQPLITPETLRRLAAKYRATAKPLVACAYANTCGVPALIASPYLGMLTTLPDDAGAKHLLRQHPDDLATVDAPEAALDIDTQDAYARLLATHSRQI